jgi:hypothetical protein
MGVLGRLGTFMSKRPTAFGKNLSIFVKDRGISSMSIYDEVVEYEGQSATISRRALENLVNFPEREPHNQTKAIIVKVLNKIQKTLVREITVTEMEMPTFNYRDYFCESIQVPRDRFDVDFIKQSLQNFVETSKRRAELINQILSLPTDHAKSQLWAKIREVIQNMGIKTDSFNEALLRGGVPEFMRTMREGSLLQHAKAIRSKSSTLSKDHQLMWKVSLSAYPPSAKETDPDLKKAARYLAWYWNRSVLCARTSWEISISKDMVMRRPSERSTIYLLCWLELPLILQTGEDGPGKVGLFELGRCFQENRSP